MDLGLLGRAATAATELGVEFLIAGLLRTAVGCLSRPLSPYPLAWCSGSGTRRRQQSEGSCRDSFRELMSVPAAMELEDGPRAAGASGHGGDRATGRFLIAGLLRTAVGCLSRPLSPYPLAWCSGSGTRRRQQSEGSCRGFLSRIDVGAGGDGAGGWTSGCWGERPRRRPSYGVDS